MKEDWKIIIDYPNYLISSCGRVKTRERKIRYVHAVTKKEHYRSSEERCLKQYTSKHGYFFVQLYKEGAKSKNFTIHRLVAINFIDNADNLKVVNHIDGNKKNNTVENLEWCTDAYNHQHAVNAGLLAKGSRVATSKLTDRCVTAILYFLSNGYSHTKLSKIFNISRASISLISEGKSWKHLTTTH